MTDISRPLYEVHGAALTTLHGDVENFARGQGAAFSGTPGSVLERSNAGGYRYYAHQSYDAAGRKVEKYVAGPVGDAAADAKAAALRTRIEGAAGALKSIRLLIREGFKYVDSKAYATIAALGNLDLFRAGALLVGSHAYGALLNQLGARAAQYATRDVDIARDAPLQFAADPRPSFLEMLKSSGIAFVEVPSLDRRKPASSFKEAGKSFFQVDLLVPSATGATATVSVPELKAHATALPYLRFLLAEPQDAVVLAREGCCVARVPAPERFALHKLIVSQLRRRGAKADNDIAQAAVLLAVLSERHPGALEEAAKSIPVSARKHVAKSSIAVRQALGAHPRALAALDAIV
ncbi:MAG: GSU2403 family nucleotidyltransferase fold protein [Burkholderiales bacterium]